MISKNLSDTAVLNIKGSDNGCIISRISKSETIKLLQNIDLTKKSGTLSKNKYQEQFFSRKFTSNSNLIEKSGGLQIKEN